MARAGAVVVVVVHLLLTVVIFSCCCCEKHSGSQSEKKNKIFFKKSSRSDRGQTVSLTWCANNNNKARTLSNNYFPPSPLGIPSIKHLYFM